jgi:hypothetical protein
MRAVLETIGVFAFATSGALLAVRREFDLVGVLMLAVITATGAASCATSSSATRRRPRSPSGRTSPRRSPPRC